jgi:RNA polymerase sigma factor (sigma-70 family)
MAWLREIDHWFLERVLPHADDYRAYARSLTRGSADADDLVQEAYARVLSLNGWRGLETPHRFVLRVIHNLAVERIRHARVVQIEQAVCLDEVEWPDPAPGPYAIAAARNDLRRVEAALAYLPAKCRQVTILRKIRGLSPNQIADRLGISVSTVEKHLVKGLQLLTKILAEQDGRTAEETQAAWGRSKTKNRQL